MGRLFSFSSNRNWLFATVALSQFAAGPLFAAAPEASPATPSSTGAAAPPAVGPAAGSAQEAFDQQFAEWRALLAEIRKVQEQYQVAADQRERAALADKFEQLLAQGRAMAPKLVAAAEKAFAENPKAAKLADFLATVAIDDVRDNSEEGKRYDGNDKYEEAYRIGKSLVTAGHKNPALDSALGVAAFCVNDYETARKYLDLAASEKSIGNRGKQYLTILDDTEKQWAKESEIRAAEAKADDLPRVKIVTTKGDVVVELFENEAPNTTANFISLVESGFYKQAPFHRVLANFVAQGGDPTGSGSGGPDYSIACECYQPDYRRHFRGSLSMAHSGRDTGGSQFFLTFVPTFHLNGKHTAFGRIVEGMEVLDQLQRIDPAKKPAGVDPDRILDAVVLRKRDHAYVPVTKAK